MAIRLANTIEKDPLYVEGAIAFDAEAAPFHAFFKTTEMQKYNFPEGLVDAMIQMHPTSASFESVFNLWTYAQPTPKLIWYGSKVDSLLCVAISATQYFYFTTFHRHKSLTFLQYRAFSNDVF